MKRIALILFTTVVSLCVRASTVTWTSGTIVLPNGNVAKAGEVTGYMFSAAEQEILLTSWYDVIHAGITKPIASTYYYDHGQRIIDAFVEIGISDAEGQINLTESGLTTVGQYNNQWAKTYYICIQDGYEYYMEVAGNHYETASPQNMRYQNLAQYGTWQQGYAVPEPTSTLLILLGVAGLTIKRHSAVVS